MASQNNPTITVDGVVYVRRWWRPFPGHGQEVVVYNLKRASPFLLVVRSSQNKLDPDKAPTAYVAVNVFDNDATLFDTMDSKHTKSGAVGGYNPDSTVSYWVSYDRDNLVVKYGKGHRMEQTTHINEKYLPLKTTPEDERKLRTSLMFNPSYHRYAELYELDVAITYDSTSILSVESKIEFDFLPFVRNPSPVIMDSSQISLMDLDNAVVTPSGSLPLKCQELYKNVINCELDWMENYDEVKLSDAIRYSIETENMTLYNKLKEKTGELGDDPKGTYLRVTLGYNVGGSPGVLYVLEIWPKDHFSPIHNHGNSFAVIKVLHGGLTVHVYNKMTEDKKEPPELMKFDVQKGDATWLSPQYFQTHKLWNQTGDFCATIQCYMYGIIYNNHWPYFDYLEDTTQIDEFIPFSDFTFRELRDSVIPEYKASLKKKEEKA